MGSGTSTLASTVATEAEKPLDAADVDTPRGVTAKEEVKRLRKMLQEMRKTQCSEGNTPGLEEYLKAAFAKHDSDNNGSLNAEEFWKLIEGLKLGLSEEDIQWLHATTDSNADNSVNLEEFIASAPSYLMQLAAKYGPATPQDWCEFQDESGYNYYYNKRTCESAWQPPIGWFEAMGRQAPDLKQFIKALTEDGEQVETGDDAYWERIIGDRISLIIDEQQKEALKEECKKNWEGKTAVFIENAPGFIMKLFESIDAESAWVIVEGEFYSLNLKTGEGRWNL